MYFQHISKSYHLDFNRERSLHAEINSPSNEYPHYILLRDPTPQKTRNTLKNVLLSTNTFLYLFLVFVGWGSSNVCSGSTCWIQKFKFKFMYFFPFVGLGPSKVCSVGSRWMHNLILLLRSAPARNLSETIVRYV